MKNYWYILFENHEQAVFLYRELKEAGFGAVIAPTPRALSLCCGVAVMIKDEEGEAVGSYLREHGCIYKRYEKLEQSFNAHNDHYA